VSFSPYREPIKSAILTALEHKRTKCKRLIKHHVSEHTENDSNDMLDHQRTLRLNPLTRCCSIRNTILAPGLTFDFNLAKTTKFNPIHDLLDPERLGIAGYSMGATAVSVVQGETDWQGTLL